MSLCTMRRSAVAARRFLVWSSGSLTIPAIMLFAVLMAVGGLAIDLQRVYGVHGQMQAYVDNAALAGAGELDGQSGAIARSFRAIIGDANAGPLITGAGWQKLATNASLGVQKITFLSTLGTDPGPLGTTPAAGDVVECTYQGAAWSPANCNTALATDKAVKFVEVVASPSTVSYLVLPVADVILQAGGGTPISSSATLALRATAGFKAKVCDIHPLMVCNPNEPVGNLNTRFPFNPVIGQQILMKASGGLGAQWGPGDFGLLQVPNDAGGVCNGNGAGALTCILGLVNPLTQCIDDSVDVKPGQAETTTNGFNVRFDEYNGSMNSKKNDPLFAPAANVTKGICNVNGGNCAYNGNNACNPNSPAPAGHPSVPLPRDANIMADTTLSTRFGNGVWNAATYWAANHPLTPALPAALGATPTRYAVYRYEIDNNLIPNITNGERGAPACSSAAGVNNPNRDRRTLIMAVVNCRAANGGAGLQGNNNGSNIPVVAYAKMFMTEPAGLVEDATGKVTGSNNSNNIFGEVIGVEAPHSPSDVYHIYPILYR